MNERTIASKTVFDGRLFRIDVLDVELDSGKRTVREIVRHPGACAILAQCSGDDDRFVFVRQFRKAAEIELLEVVAGTLDPGESPDACALREVREETGYEVETLRRLGVCYPAAGYTQEKLHLYYARLKPSPGPRAPDEDEQLEVQYASAAEVEEMIAQGDIVDGKTLAIWLLYSKQTGDL